MMKETAVFVYQFYRISIKQAGNNRYMDSYYNNTDKYERRLAI